jgi:hypothetical protein
MSSSAGVESIEVMRGATSSQKAGQYRPQRSSSSLVLDYCSGEAARYANDKWHYSTNPPSGSRLFIGVWEHGRFIGAVMFGRGANPTIGSPYGLQQSQICELTRVALSRHEAPVTKIVAIALRLLARRSPGIKMVVSYADPNQGHLGKIYQAGNWTYVGVMPGGRKSTYVVRGKPIHSRTASMHVRRYYGTGLRDDADLNLLDFLRAKFDPNARVEVRPAKFKYVMPLHDDMRAMVAALAKPYPKAAELDQVLRVGD